MNEVVKYQVTYETEQHNKIIHIIYPIFSRICAALIVSTTPPKLH